MESADSNIPSFRNFTMTDAFQAGRYKQYAEAAKAGDPATIASFFYTTGVLVNAGESTAVVGRAGRSKG